MPQEYELIRFIACVKYHHSSWKAENSANKWVGVECDAQGTIRGISWENMHLSGTLQWEYIPQSLTYLSLCRNMLSGSVNWSYIPPQLEVLRLTNNAFEGSIELRSLPHTLREFWVPDNFFSGDLCFDYIPDNLRSMFLSRNRDLGGVIDMQKLPNTLRLRDWFDTKIVVK